MCSDVVVWAAAVVCISYSRTSPKPRRPVWIVRESSYPDVIFEGSELSSVIISGETNNFIGRVANNN